jgi:hypothetical protein
METLRIISWNCGVGGFRYKSANVEPLCADILAAYRLGGAHSPVRPILLLAVRPGGAGKRPPACLWGVNAGLRFLKIAGLKFPRSFVRFGR